MAKYFKNPFGINGDLTDIPDDTQLDGSVSYNTGWGDVYQRDPSTDSKAKRLSRAKHNKLFNDITTNIKEWQQQTFPVWISDAGSGMPYAYSKDAIVTYTDARAYVSLVNNNTGKPTLDTANWKLFENFGGINIHSLTAKTTLVDNDELALADSASSFSLKKLTFANLKTVLKSFFVDLTSTQTITGTKTFSGTVTAPTFSGALNGNAATATTAGSCTGNAATATTATNVNGGTVNATTGRFANDIIASQSITIGTGGTYSAGSIYSDSDWGMVFRAKQPSPAIAPFKWTDSSGGELFSFNGTALTTNITGNSGTSTALVGNETNWKSYRSSSVANMLGWNKYGNGNVIFDASASTSPNGVAVSNTNPNIPWSPIFPTLMGWNGSRTCGVRVDSARVADYVTNSTGLGTDQTWQDVTASRVSGTTYTNSTGKPIFVLLSFYNDIFVTLGAIPAFGANNEGLESASSNISIVIPNGSTYRFDTTHAIHRWLELR